jgi:hypothetical protein
MPQKYQPTPRTDSGWSWADFWNWYRMQSKQSQRWTLRENDLRGEIKRMTPDVQNEVLFYAPVEVQALFDYGTKARVYNARAEATKLLRSIQ